MYLHKPIEIIKYPEPMYKLHDKVAEMFGVDKLEDLDNVWEPDKVLDREHDQDTPFHRRFYKRFQNIQPVYTDFINEVVRPYIGEDFVYQKIPTFRIQFPNNLAIGEKHKDSDYSHSKDEINFWLPLTDLKPQNTIWIEDEPVMLDWGECLIFDGANLEHENKLNTSGYTRVSFDFRVIPKSKYKPSEKRSINTNMKMSVGGYWLES